MQRVSVVLLLGTVWLLFACPTAVASANPSELLTTPMEIEVTGAARVNVSSGAALVEAVSINDIVLHAEEVRIDQWWEKGVDADAPPVRGTYVVDQGEDSVTIAGATVSFGAFQGPPLLFVGIESDAAQMTAVSGRGVKMAAGTDATLVGVGTPPDVVQAGQGSDLGFWYTAEGDTVVGEMNGLLHVTGDFTLFLHNATIEATGADCSWSDWTGFQAGQSGQPLTDYEFRVTVLTVHNGTLAVPADSAITFASPALQAEVDGTTTVPHASGRIVRAGIELLFDEEPVTLTGAGHIHVSAANTGLSLAPSPGLDVLGFAGSTQDTGLGTPSNVTTWSLLALALITLTTAGMTELGVLPGPTPALQRRRFARWMRRGRDASVRHKWALAAWCYEKAVRARRSDPLAWYDWAYAELEAGHWADAEDVARRAGDVPGVDPLDLLEVRAAAAWESGDRVAFASHLGELVQASPAMARGFVQDMAIDVEVLEARLRRLIEPTRAEDAMDGYA